MLTQLQSGARWFRQVQTDGLIRGVNGSDGTPYANSGAAWSKFSSPDFPKQVEMTLHSYPSLIYRQQNNSSFPVRVIANKTFSVSGLIYYFSGKRTPVSDPTGRG